MKKIILVALLAGFLTGPSFAQQTIVTSQGQMKDWIRAWKLEAGTLDSYGVMNLSGAPLKVSYFVNGDFDDGRKTSDIVTFKCADNVSYLTPGQWVVCNLEDGTDSEVHIEGRNYHNGAEGFTQF